MVGLGIVRENKFMVTLEGAPGEFLNFRENFIRAPVGDEKLESRVVAKLNTDSFQCRTDKTRSLPTAAITLCWQPRAQTSNN